MAIQAGETTFYQAKRGIVQDGLVLNLDAAVDASYSGGTTWRDLTGSNNGTLTNMIVTNFNKVHTRLGRPAGIAPPSSAPSR